MYRCIEIAIGIKTFTNALNEQQIFSLLSHSLESLVHVKLGGFMIMSVVNT